MPSRENVAIEKAHKIDIGENPNGLRIDERYVYSFSGKPYARVPARDRNHHRDRRLPFIKRATAKGNFYHYFKAPGGVILGKLPNPTDPAFDNAYLKMLAIMEGERAPDYLHPVTSNVYFIGCEQAIKIGVAKCVNKRFATLQTHSPSKLEVLAVIEGGRKEEREYHARFAAHRLHGEWFAPHPDILAEITRLTTPAQGAE